MSKYYYLGSQSELDTRYRATITLYNAAGEPAYTIEGNIQNDFAVSGGNTYDEQGAAIESAANRLETTAKIVAGKNLAETISSAGTGSNKFLTQVGSQLTWQGSKSSTLNLEMTFVCLKAGTTTDKEDVVTRVNTLMRAVYPDLNEDTKGLVFTPPMGYATKIFGKSKAGFGFGASATHAGKASLKLGRWFHAHYLVIEDVNFSYSKELNRLGRPLYAIGSVALRPYKTLTYSEFQKWFL